MASSYIWTGTRFIPTHRLRSDTMKPDVDIARYPQILAERIRYEERHHSGQSREETFELELEMIEA